MRILHIIPISLCVLVAFMLPADLVKPSESSPINIARTKPAAPISAPQYAQVKQLGFVEVPETPATPQAVIYHSDDFYEEYIIQHESGGNLVAVNSIGCVGIMQSCGGGLESSCPNWADDLPCQLKYFENYSNSRYGTWANAYAFKVRMGWW